MNKAGDDATYLLIQCPMATEVSNCVVHFFAFSELHRPAEGLIWKGGIETLTSAESWTVAHAFYFPAKAKPSIFSFNFYINIHILLTQLIK